mgnify:CR=1 FL=1
MAEEKKKRTGPKKSPSVKKRERQNLKRRLRNRWWKGRIKAAKRALLGAIESNNKEEVEKLLREAVSIIQRAGQKGIIHWRKAARDISKLYHKANKVLLKVS